jgi:hypothetical protein
LYYYDDPFARTAADVNLIAWSNQSGGLGPFGVDADMACSASGTGRGT